MYQLENMSTQDVHFDVAKLEEFDEKLLTIPAAIDTEEESDIEPRVKLTNKQFEALKGIKAAENMIEQDSGQLHAKKTN